jgi:hypothetical protein
MARARDSPASRFCPPTSYRPLAVAESAILPSERRTTGPLAAAWGAGIGGRRGGLARAGRARLVASLGLAEISDESTFKPYRLAADDYGREQLASLAAQSRGEVGPGPSTMVASAALQLAPSRWAFDQAAKLSDAALMKLGSSLANDSRQNLLAAFELAVRESKVRGDAGRNAPPAWFVASDKGEAP